MTNTQRLASAFGAVSLCYAAASCGGSDGPTSSGFIHVGKLQISPQIVNCGASPLATPPRTLASPDSVALEVEMVNSTATPTTLVSAGSNATIVSSSNTPTDVGTSVLNYTTLPFTPLENTIRAHDGDVTFRVSMPMEPYCNSKSLTYVGEQDLELAVRMTTDTGVYTSLPQSLRIIWNGALNHVRADR